MSSRTLQDIVAVLSSKGTPSTRTLYEIWEQGQGANERGGGRSTVALAADPSGFDWLTHDVSLVVSFARSALKREEYLLVCDAVRAAASVWQGREPVDASAMSELFVAYAVAKIRIGQSGEAFRSLQPWSQDARLDKLQRAKIILQLGDILNEEAHATVDPSIRFQRAERALNLYLEASKLDPDSMRARVKIATALFSVSGNLPGRLIEARKWAAEALSDIARKEKETGKTFASALNIAAMLAVTGKLEEAMQAYASLRFFPESTTSELADARHQSQFVAIGAGKPSVYFKSAFPGLELILFAGHLPDLPGRPSRFTSDQFPLVRDRLRKTLEELDARVALVSASAGADLLFIEAFLERRDAELHIVLPWSKDEFFRVSVQPYDCEGVRPTWCPLFEKAIGGASTIRQLSQLTEPSDQVGWQYALEVTAGIALQTARVSRLDVRPVALWDGKPGRGPGGTGSFIELWNNSLGRPPLVIPLPEADRHDRQKVQISHFEPSERPTMHREVKTMLFADVVGYSKLTESVIREFVNVFLKKLSRLIADSPYPPHCLNMWGDEIYGVFDHAREAGMFALQLVKFLREEEAEWLRQGLYYEEFDPTEEKMRKYPLNIRVGLHTGPVLAVYNPVVRQLTYTGSHVTRAARIQPVAGYGEVYASEEFASMLEFDLMSRSNGQSVVVPSEDGDTVCRYAGTMRLAKAFPGRFRIYRVVAEKTLPIDALAAATHQLYCEVQSSKGEVLPPNSPALLSWQELPEQFREANRSQVADIPFKLGLIGFELTSGPGVNPMDLKLTPEMVETLSKMEHERWLMERQRAGWTHAPTRDNSRKYHPSMVPWELLPESEKEKDREVVRALPKLIEAAGLRLSRKV